MTFTLVFPSIARNLSYMLAFEPTPVWKKDSKWLKLKPQSDGPHYVKGGLRQLIEQEQLEGDLIRRQCALLVQQEGHGREADLAVLEEELREAGFTYHIVQF